MLASANDPMQPNRGHPNRARPLAKARHLAKPNRLRWHADDGRHVSEHHHERDHADAHAAGEHDRPVQPHRYPRANEASIARAQKAESAGVKEHGSCQTT